MRRAHAESLGIVAAVILAGVCSCRSGAEESPPQSIVQLGRRLFFDPRLSVDDTVSCATCHDPRHGFGGAESLSSGIARQKTLRHTPTLINLFASEALFWDGRAKTLEEQALLPIESPREMSLPLDLLERKLEEIPEYRRAFQELFGSTPSRADVARALAAFERSLVSRDTPFDRYSRGDRAALSAAARRGMILFFGEARCALCHSGENFTDNDFHNVGVPTTARGEPARKDTRRMDSGRFAVTGRDSDRGAFKTPTLREVARSAPYMHNGVFTTLRQVVEHYNFGGVTDEENPHRDERLEVLYLGEEQVTDVVTFLEEGLSSDSWELLIDRIEDESR